MQNQAEDVSERSGQDSEHDETSWGGWLVVALWLVVLPLIAVGGQESSTYPDSDGIQHQFDPTWGDRVGIFFGTIVIAPLLILYTAGFLFAIGWIVSSTWTFVRGRWAARSRRG